MKCRALPSEKSPCRDTCLEQLVTFSLDISRERLCNNSFTIGPTHWKLIQITQQKLNITAAAPLSVIVLHFQLLKQEMVDNGRYISNRIFSLDALANQEMERVVSSLFQLSFISS